MLEARRAELDPAFRNLTLFARERGIDYRLAWDIEHGRRANYRRVTLTAIEIAYGWQPGSIRRVLDGREPVPVAGIPAPPRPRYTDPDLQQIWELNLPENVRLGMIALARDMREADENGNGAERPA